MSATASFFEELKRRNVVRVGLVYLITAWLLAQVADLMLENFNAPDWVIQAILVVLIIGFPLALVFAWAYELTPEGLKKEKDVDRTQSITPQTGRKLDFIIIGVLAVALGYFIAFLGRWVLEFPTVVPLWAVGLSLAMSSVVGLGFGIWWVMRYAARVRADPSASLVAAGGAAVATAPGAAPPDDDAGSDVPTAMSGRQTAILVVFFLAFIVMMVGVIPWGDLGISAIPTWGWWFPEMTASFIAFAIVIGVIGAMSESTFTSSFVDGARDLLGVALIIGVTFCRLKRRAASFVGQMIFIDRGMQATRWPSTLRTSASDLTERAGPTKHTARYFRLVVILAGSTM